MQETLATLSSSYGAGLVARWVVSGKRLQVLSRTIGSAFMGAGIAAMHYTGMAAMRLPAMCHYNRAIVGASILNAVVVSAVALLLSFHFRGTTKEFNSGKMLSSAVSRNDLYEKCRTALGLFAKNSA
jgi:NO-binding membrane sensor protein with MHYT domain